MQSHDYFFEGSVAGAFADPVEGALHLACARLDGSEGVGDGEAEIIMAVGAENRIGRSTSLGDDLGKHVAVFFGCSVAGGIGKIDSSGASGDGGLDDLDKEIDFSAGGIFRGEFDVGGEAAGAANSIGGETEDLVAGFAEFKIAMDFASTKKNVNPAPFASRFHGGASGVNVGVDAAGQATDDGSADGPGNFLDRIKIAATGNRKAGFDNIDAKSGELAGDFEFLATRHGGAWALLPVAKSGVEDLNMRARGHRMSLARNSQRRTR